MEGAFQSSQLGFETSNSEEKTCVTNLGVEFKRCVHLSDREGLIKATLKLHYGKCRMGAVHIYGLKVADSLLPFTILKLVGEFSRACDLHTQF